MENQKRPGRPRKLKADSIPGDVPEPVVTQAQDQGVSTIQTEKVAKNDSGKEYIAPIEGFDFRQLHTLKPWRADEPLPESVTKLDRKGRPILVKKGDPRFFFRGNLLIKTYKGMAVKTDLYKRFKPEKKKLHAQIMQYLKNKVGIQERYG